MEESEMQELVERLGQEEDSVRKMAAFKLQGAIGDPSFAEVFVAHRGLPKLGRLCLRATGNTLAYSLASLSKLLELDRGWELVGGELIMRTVQLVVTQSLVNILRGAMSVLVAVVSYPHSHSTHALALPGYGFKALKPAMELHPQFLELLVSRLSSGDHILGANALQLVNALMRDALTNDAETEWSRFIKRLQDLGVVKAVYVLMQSTALTDLAAPLLDFQTLTKMMLKKWRDVQLDVDKPEHRRALKALDTTSRAERAGVDGGSRDDRPDRWRRLGFATENPAGEFDAVGFLGIMDMTDFVRKDQDQYQKLLLEQGGMAPERRCPIARASLAVTAILYDHFAVDGAERADGGGDVTEKSDARSVFDKAFRPLLLHWSRLHTAGLNAFLRLWKVTGAEVDDFEKVEDLVRILVEQVVGQAPRIKEMYEVEDEMADFEVQRLRELQMELLESTFEDAWGHHLRQVRDELNHEALQFIKEQRIRCLLQGDWFPLKLGHGQEPAGPVTKQTLAHNNKPSGWRYVRLSHNRRYLHYADFDAQTVDAPALDDLEHRIDLSIVSSVDSKLSASRPSTPDTITAAADAAAAIARSAVPPHHSARPAATTLTIRGHVAGQPRSGSGPSPQRKRASGGEKQHVETALLTLQPPSHTLAAEWLDGLLMLLNQQPITTDTNKLVRLIGGYGLRIRLLNMQFGDVGPGVGAGVNGIGGEVKMPGREGVDDEFYYEIAGM